MNNIKREIAICGIGPGNPDLILPLVWKRVESAELLIGGKRQLALFSHFNKEEIDITGNLSQLKSLVELTGKRKIAVVVSGDTGFYSLRNYITKQFTADNLEVIPGISTYQYMYAKINMGYEKAYISSVHGRENNFISKMDIYESMFLLTDEKNNWRVIAQQLVDSNNGDKTLFIGNRLSYDDEQIVEAKASELVTHKHQFELCAVIIKTDNNEG